MREERKFVPASPFAADIPRGQQAHEIRPVHSSDEEYLSPEYIRRNIDKIVKALGNLAALADAESHLVDEYQVQGLSESGGTVTWIPDYETQEIIEAVIVTGPLPITGLEFDDGSGVTTPAANQVLASIVVPQGSYTLNWIVGLGGTTGTPEISNFNVTLNGVVIAHSENSSSSGSFSTQSPFTISVPAGGGTIAITVGANAPTAASVYRCQGVLTGSSEFTLQLGKRTWQLALPASGVLVIAPIKISLDRSDTRKLTAANAGDWAVELCGYAEKRHWLR